MESMPVAEVNLRLVAWGPRKGVCRSAGGEMYWLIRYFEVCCMGRVLQRKRCKMLKRKGMCFMWAAGTTLKKSCIFLNEAERVPLLSYGEKSS